MQIHFIAGGAGGGLHHPFAYKSPPRFADGHIFYGSVCQLRPESTGEITLRSADPFDTPLIRAKSLSSPTDRRIVREGVKLVREIFAQPAMDPHRGEEIAPGVAVQSDADLDAFVARAWASTRARWSTRRCGCAGGRPEGGRRLGDAQAGQLQHPRTGGDDRREGGRLHPRRRLTAEPHA